MLILYLVRDEVGSGLKLGVFKGPLILSFLFVGFTLIRKAKKYYLKKYPEFIDPNYYSQESIRNFKVNVISLSVIIILPALFLIYKALFEF
jgi:hypothetical protein